MQDHVLYKHLYMTSLMKSTIVKQLKLFGKESGNIFTQKPFFPDNCNTYNMNDNPKNKIFLSENIRQKRLTILEYFDAYICHHYQPKMIQ